jgi:hypothetical protein
MQLWIGGRPTSSRRRDRFSDARDEVGSSARSIWKAAVIEDLPGAAGISSPEQRDLFPIDVA